MISACKRKSGIRHQGQSTPEDVLKQPYRKYDATAGANFTDDKQVTRVMRLGHQSSVAAEKSFGLGPHGQPTVRASLSPGSSRIGASVATGEHQNLKLSVNSTDGRWNTVAQGSGLNGSFWHSRETTAFGAGGTVFKSNGWTSALSLFGLRSNRIQDLGEAAADEEQEIAAARGINVSTDGMRRIAVRRGRMFSGSIKAGVNLLAGMVGRFDNNYERSVEYSSYVTHHVALRTLQGKKSKSTAVPLTIPDLADLEALNPFDEMLITSSGRYNCAALVSVGCVSVGTQVIVEGNRRLLIKKLTDGNIEVTDTPTKVKGVRLFANHSLGPQVSQGNYNVDVFFSRMVFDIKTANGLARYREAITGQMKFQVPSIWPEETTLAPEVALARQLKRCPEISDGVTLKVVGRVRARFTRRSIGWYLSFIPSFIWAVGTIKWGRDSSCGHEEELKIKRTRGTSSTIRSRRNSRDSFLHGRQSLGFEIREHWSHSENKRSFMGLSIIGSFEATDVQSKNFNTEFLQPLCRSTGNFLGWGRDEGGLHQWAVSRHLSQSHLLSWCQAPYSERALAAVERTAALPRGSLSELQDAIKGTSGLSEEATVRKCVAAITDFALAHGAAASIGALHHLMRARGGYLIIEQNDSAFTSCSTDVSRFTMENASPITANMSRVELQRRFKMGLKLMQRIHAMNKRLGSMLLLPVPSHVEIIDRLKRDEQRLRQNLAVAQTDRAAVCRTLRSGLWHNTSDYHILNYLDPPVAAESLAQVAHWRTQLGQGGWAYLKSLHHAHRTWARTRQILSKPGFHHETERSDHLALAHASELRCDLASLCADPSMRRRLWHSLPHSWWLSFLGWRIVWYLCKSSMA